MRPKFLNEWYLSVLINKLRLTGFQGADDARRPGAIRVDSNHPKCVLILLGPLLLLSEFGGKHGTCRWLRRLILRGGIRHSR